MLEVEDRPDYILEYRATDNNLAWYGPCCKGEQFSASWREASHGKWHAVESMQNKGSVAGGRVAVLCTLPALPNDADASLTGVGADAVQFRQCVSARASAHPCRWVGSSSTPIATAFA